MQEPHRIRATSEFPPLRFCWAKIDWQRRSLSSSVTISMNIQRVFIWLRAGATRQKNPSEKLWGFLRSGFFSSPRFFQDLDTTTCPRIYSRSFKASEEL